MDFYHVCKPRQDYKFGMYCSYIVYTPFSNLIRSDLWLPGCAYKWQTCLNHFFKLFVILLKPFFPVFPLTYSLAVFPLSPHSGQLKRVKPNTCFIWNTWSQLNSSLRAPAHSEDKALSALFHVFKLTGACDWSASCWLTLAVVDSWSPDNKTGKESEWIAPFIQRALLMVANFSTL